MPDKTLLQRIQELEEGLTMMQAQNSRLDRDIQAERQRIDQVFGPEPRTINVSEAAAPAIRYPEIR